MKTSFLILTLLTLLCLPGLARAVKTPKLLLAVAANFTDATEKIAAAFEKESGIEVQEVYSSTGKLYAQIKNGAPYDLFLAADARRPQLLAEQGVCETPFIYATGAAILWSKDPALAGETNWRDAVMNDGARKIAIANPQTAPYGAAALTALEKSGLFSRIRDRLVYGQNVAQAFQYAYFGSTDLAFTALSFALSEQGHMGRYWPLPEAPAVMQEGCVIKNSAHKEAVAKFLAFFRRPGTARILKEFGYR